MTHAVEVITHRGLDVDALSTTQLRRIYSMRQSVWPSGEAIVVYVLPSEHQVHKVFSREVLKIFPYQLDRIWNKLVFSGVGKKPIVVDSPEALLEAVKSTPGAIGYAPILDSQESISVVKINQ